MSRQRAHDGLDWLIDRLCEKSTAAALVGAMIVLVGWQVSPERIDAIATLVSFGLGAVAFVTREHRDPPHDDPPHDGGGH